MKLQIKIRKILKFFYLTLNLKHINGKTIYGADVVTIINKAIDNNEKNGIEKDSEDLYIKDDKKSVKVELTLLSKDEEGNSKELKLK